MLDKPTKQKNLFKVPENYFENFNAEIMDKLPAKKQVKIVPLWKKVLPWTAVAAVLTGLILTIGLMNNSEDTVADHIGGKDASNDENVISSTRQLSAAEEDDYFKYLEDEATRSSYRDMLYNDF